MRQRRLMNQINVVPYIDVMLVLLVIFMVTAPMIQTGTVDLPSVGSASMVQTRPWRSRWRPMAASRCANPAASSTTCPANNWWRACAKSRPTTPSSRW